MVCSFMVLDMGCLSFSPRGVSIYETLLLRGPGCLEEREDLGNQAAETLVSCWEMWLFAQLLGDDATSYRKQEIKHELSREGGSNNSSIDHLGHGLHDSHTPLKSFLNAPLCS